MIEATSSGLRGSSASATAPGGTGVVDEGREGTEEGETAAVAEAIASTRDASVAELLTTLPLDFLDR